MMSKREKKEIDYGLYNKNNSVTTPCCKVIHRSVNMRIAATLDTIDKSDGIEWVYDAYNEELENRDNQIGAKLVVLGGKVHGYSCDSPVPLIIKSNHFENESYAGLCFCFLGLEHNPFYKRVDNCCPSIIGGCCTVGKAYLKKLERMKMYSDAFIQKKDVYLKEVDDLKLYVVKHPKVIMDLLKLKEFDALFVKKVVYIAKISKIGKKLRKTKLDYSEIRPASRYTDPKDGECEDEMVEEDENSSESENENNGESKWDETNKKDEMYGGVNDDEETIEEGMGEEEEEEFDVLEEPKEKTQKKNMTSKSSSVQMESNSLMNNYDEKKDVVTDEIKELLGGSSICIDVSKFEMFRIWIADERTPIIDDKLKFKVFIPSKFTSITMNEYLTKSGIKSNEFEKVKSTPINAQVDMELTIAYV